MRIVGDVGSAVVPKPTASIKESATGTAVTGSMTDIVEYNITDTKRFELAKIQLACETACWVNVLLDDEIVSYGIVGDEQTFVDWYPSGDACAAIGDGSKTVVIRAEALSTSGTVKGIIMGSEE